MSDMTSPGLDLSSTSINVCQTGVQTSWEVASLRHETQMKQESGSRKRSRLSNPRPSNTRSKTNDGLFVLHEKLTSPLYSSYRRSIAKESSPVCNWPNAPQPQQATQPPYGLENSSRPVQFPIGLTRLSPLIQSNTTVQDQIVISNIQEPYAKQNPEVTTGECVESIFRSSAHDEKNLSKLPSKNFPEEISPKIKDMQQRVSEKAEAKPVFTNKEAKPVSTKIEAKPVSRKKEAKPNLHKETNPTSNRDAKTVSTNKEAKPTLHKEAKPTSQKETNPTSNRDTKPVSTNKEVKPVSTNKEAQPVSRKKEAKPNLHRETNPTSNRDAKTVSTNKVAKPTLHKEAKPTLHKEAKPTLHKEAKPTSHKETNPTSNRDAKPVSTNKEAKPTLHRKAKPTSPSTLEAKPYKEQTIDVDAKDKATKDSEIDKSKKSANFLKETQSPKPKTPKSPNITPYYYDVRTSRGLPSNVLSPAVAVVDSVIGSDLELNKALDETGTISEFRHLASAPLDDSFKKTNAATRKSIMNGRRRKGGPCGAINDLCCGAFDTCACECCRKLCGRPNYEIVPIEGLVFGANLLDTNKTLPTH
eukprot:GHVP01024288.1.p2 GENE.GHVP01024288.1~~GHVP01024288.1.p2  ORF type:complete len:584 (+),score=140.93 GHVP01024288.1:2965-4716(+)